MWTRRGAATTTTITTTRQTCHYSSTIFLGEPSWIRHQCLVYCLLILLGALTGLAGEPLGGNNPAAGSQQALNNNSSVAFKGQLSSQMLLPMWSHSRQGTSDLGGAPLHWPQETASAPQVTTASHFLPPTSHRKQLPGIRTIATAAASSSSSKFASRKGDEKWQKKSSKSSSSGSERPANNRTLESSRFSLPIRHWWAAMYHHKPPMSFPKSSKRSSRSSSLLQSQPRSLISHLFQCLEKSYPNHVTPDVMTFHGAVEWADRVCNTTTLDERVRLLLEALPCPQHRLCQVLSPSDLVDIARPDKCHDVVHTKWRTLFHKLYVVIRDFSEVFQHKFDIGDYSAMYENQRCKDAYTFWTCSTQLPMWLLDPDTNKSVQVQACESSCREVERSCPFLIRGNEGDMAAGNPSFLCKDETVPTVVTATDMPSQCCYSAMADPLPGQGYPIHVSSGFCHEPDHVQFHLRRRGMSKNYNNNGTVTNGTAGGSKQSPASLPSSSLSSSPATEKSNNNQNDNNNNNALLAPRCDKLLRPSAALNVTNSTRANEWLGWYLSSTEMDTSLWQWLTSWG